MLEGSVVGRVRLVVVGVLGTVCRLGQVRYQILTFQMSLQMGWFKLSKLVRSEQA